jgi:hypothetical protein
VELQGKTDKARSRAGTRNLALFNDGIANIQSHDQFLNIQKQGGPFKHREWERKSEDVLTK